ncbi:MAG TPA: 50S ribosomal protein L18a [Methanomicrobia archaeon]|nr:Ribosomal protein L20A [Candidatus Alkanophaga volatiphilum]HDO63386.1 50S ribosomal protein L18a [Methanomicrobia archaeon]HEX58979.1 50S ribosomal protein L18a [Methanomicrobia archaeon]
MPRYLVEGEFRTGNKWQKFRKEVECLSEKLAVEKVLSIMGSKHRLKRNMIRIKKVVQQDGETTSSMSMASSSP